MTTSPALAAFRRTQIRNNIAALMALRDARAAENKAAREACKADPALCAALLADAQRRGMTEIDWTEYFRNLDINYP